MNVNVACAPPVEETAAVSPLHGRTELLDQPAVNATDGSVSSNRLDVSLDTVKEAALTTEPPEAVTLIGPLVAPEGTVV